MIPIVDRSDFGVGRWSLLKMLQGLSESKKNEESKGEKVGTSWEENPLKRVNSCLGLSLKASKVIF